MPVHLLDDRLSFPPVELATPEGVLAVGDDLRIERLLAAYANGIFPWPVRGFPLLWFCPDPRYVLPVGEAHLGRTLRKEIRRARFEVRYDTAFTEVIDGCAHVPRPGQDGTWITSALRNAFVQLHQLGYAHSVEAWRAGRLVGGLYGVSLGGVFFGESMFALEANASKVAFAHLLERLEGWGHDLVDCQVETEHLARFGARPWARTRFLDAVRSRMSVRTRRGRWSEDNG
ncbi:MAG: leucyl/phenylalanyl-tRNA--protein transferase [Myxococcota bacterium]